MLCRIEIKTIFKVTLLRKIIRNFYIFLDSRIYSSSGRNQMITWQMRLMIQNYSICFKHDISVMKSQ